MKTVYLYGMRNRGFSIGCQPIEGFVDAQDDILDEYHSILAYDRRLTDKEVKDYELDYLHKKQIEVER